jgi:hypothetical protein
MVIGLGTGDLLEMLSACTDSRKLPYTTTRAPRTRATPSFYLLGTAVPRHLFTNNSLHLFQINLLHVHPLHATNLHIDGQTATRHGPATLDVREP